MRCIQHDFLIAFWRLTCNANKILALTSTPRFDLNTTCIEVKASVDDLLGARSENQLKKQQPVLEL